MFAEILLNMNIHLKIRGRCMGSGSLFEIIYFVMLDHVDGFA